MTADGSLRLRRASRVLLPPLRFDPSIPFMEALLAVLATLALSSAEAVLPVGLRPLSACIAAELCGDEGEASAASLAAAPWFASRMVLWLMRRTARRVQSGGTRPLRQRCVRRVTNRSTRTHTRSFPPCHGSDRFGGPPSICTVCRVMHCTR